MIFFNTTDDAVVDMQLALTLLKEHWEQNAQSCLYTEREQQAITAVILPGLEEIRRQQVSLAYFWRWIEALRMPTMIALEAQAIPEDIGLRFYHLVGQLRRDMVLLYQYNLQYAQAMTHPESQPERIEKDLDNYGKTEP